MTDTADTRLPSPPPDDVGTRRRARRGTLVTIGVLAALVVLIVLLTPVSDSGNDTRLTTRKYGPGNARLAADLARRLGWPVQHRDAALDGTLDTTVIYAVFGGPTPMSLSERRTLLNAVRHGAGLLVAPATEARLPLLDSLGLRTGKVGDVTPTPLGDCPRQTDPLSALRVRPRMVTFDTAAPKRASGATRVPFPATSRTLLASDVGIDDRAEGSDGRTRDSVALRSAAGVDTVRATPVPRRPTPTAKNAVNLQPTVVAFALGRGRVVALADPDVLRTDQLRNCAMGPALTAIRALEYLSAGGRRPIVFVERYQAVRADGPSVVLREWLLNTGAGRGVLTLMGAGLLLLIARGRRTLAPVYRLREERRSPLEHVDALATAWRAVRGTRTVARQLARGVRRRHAAGRWRSLDDAEFLAALAQRHPSISDDVRRLTGAIDQAVAPSELPALRRAAAHIDAECLTP